jgi:flagellar secretion chaperone FliS
MHQTYGIHQYRQIAMQTMAPGRMIVMLYEGALRFLEQGRAAMQENDVETRALFLNKAQAIVSELRFSLDHGAGASFTKELESLYDYVISEINQTSFDQDPIHIANAVRTLEPLLEAWRQIPINSTGDPRGTATEVANLSNSGTIPAEDKGSTPDGSASGMKSNLCVAV